MVNGDHFSWLPLPCLEIMSIDPRPSPQASSCLPAQVLNPSRGRVRSPASPLSPSTPSICSGLLGLISWRNTVTCSTSSARSNPRSVSLVALSRFCSGLSRERRRQNQRHRQRHIIVSFSFYFLGIASRIEGKTWLDSDRTQSACLVCCGKSSSITSCATSANAFQKASQSSFTTWNCPVRKKFDKIK